MCCRVLEEPKPTPTVNIITYQPSPSTSRPYVTPAVQTPRPVLTRQPNNGYLPPKEEIPSGNNPVESYLPPDKGEDELSEPIQPQTANDSPVINRGEQDAAPQLKPAGCAAALNCTRVEYCTANGEISPTPVELTPQQKAYRVPLSECRDEAKGIPDGVCCKDPNYTDPWPTALLRSGGFDANILAQSFDDGQYRPNNNNNGNGIQRGEAQKSPQILSQNLITPAQSQENKQYTLAPFKPNAIQNNNKNSVPQPNFQRQQQQQPTLQFQPTNSPLPFSQQPIQPQFIQPKFPEQFEQVNETKKKKKITKN